MVDPVPDDIPEYTDALVIGGGPSGIVSLKYALAAGWTATLVEMEAEIGGTFRWRSYDNAELVSSKQLTCFSDFRYPLAAPDHPSLPNFVAYLHDYATHFGLWPHVHLSTKVTTLARTGPPAYPHRATVQTAAGRERTILARRVVVTTGLHVVPNVPAIPGLTTKRTTASPAFMHSSEYKRRGQVADRRVLVLGCGETGMDVTHEAVLADARVWLGVRSGFLSFPKVLNNFRVLGMTFDGNLPIDGLITNLMETAYVHPWVSASHLRWFVSDFVIRRVLWVLTGTMAGCNQWAGELPPERQGRAYVFLNKSARAMPFINRPHFQLSRLHQWFAHYIDPPLPDVKHPSVDVVPFPTSFDSEGRAVFPPPPLHRAKEVAWKDECRPELVVLCTGYRQQWDWMDSSYATPDTCDVRGICRSDDPSVAFIGFLRPGVGAIPPMAEMQAQFFTLLATSRMPVPSSPETYHLLHSPTGRIQYGVDYSTYMSQLARDMGSAPGLYDLWRTHGWFITFVYCFGAAFPTFYRLTGPFQSETAPQIVRTELWETIKRRGMAGNLFMGVIPMAFYAIVNLVAAVLEAAWVGMAPHIGYKPSVSESQIGQYLRQRQSTK